jgi:lysophospholipase L1-like esterase
MALADFRSAKPVTGRGLLKARLKRPLRFIGRALLLAAVWAAIFEAGLRAQQYFGPLYDLELTHVDLSWESNVLNHVPAATNQQMCIYGDTTGFTYERSYDANGVRIIDDSELMRGCQRPVSVLFLGDSFMEGYDDRNTLPWHVAKYFREQRGVCLKTHNAGFTSYSPSIFVPQAKKLLPVLRPEYIVLDVDETDFYDDFVRYRRLIVRDESGRNIGVRVSPVGHECSAGLMQVREHALYLTRFVSKLWLTSVHMPAVIRKNQGGSFGLFDYSRDQGADVARKYADARAVFRRNLQELATVLKDYTQDGKRVVCVFHPHLEHLKPDTKGHVWNDLVSSTVREACTANGFFFFNATGTLKQRFGSHPEDFYWGDGDMHFNFEGLQAYSDAVAEFMASKMINPND